MTGAPVSRPERRERGRGERERGQQPRHGVAGNPGAEQRGLRLGARGRHPVVVHRAAHRVLDRQAEAEREHGLHARPPAVLPAVGEHDPRHVVPDDALAQHVVAGLVEPGYVERGRVDDRAARVSGAGARRRAPASARLGSRTSPRQRTGSSARSAARSNLPRLSMRSNSRRPELIGQATYTASRKPIEEYACIAATMAVPLMSELLLRRR
ncbi:hypothetical protein APASM_4934 [Actinosynnema pretiosum subsp. pretiosum]|nr:hypothetical protein APASM_4934 [Actinosynnema pretiosum subsp. pretiosum]